VASCNSPSLAPRLSGQFWSFSCPPIRILPGLRADVHTHRTVLLLPTLVTNRASRASSNEKSLQQASHCIGALHVCVFHRAKPSRLWIVGSPPALSFVVLSATISYYIVLVLAALLLFYAGSRQRESPVLHAASLHIALWWCATNVPMLGLTSRFQARATLYYTTYACMKSFHINCADNHVPTHQTSCESCWETIHVNKRPSRSRCCNGASQGRHERTN
jgi:hypothetical protein